MTTQAVKRGEATARRGPGRPKKPKAAPGRKFAQVTVQLPPDLVADLDREAEAEGAGSRSELIRRACAEMLRRREKRRAGGI